jgi:hypothetical protein
MSERTPCAEHMFTSNTNIYQLKMDCYHLFMFSRLEALLCKDCSWDQGGSRKEIKYASTQGTLGKFATFHHQWGAYHLCWAPSFQLVP